MATWKKLLENEQSAELWMGRIAAAYQQEKSAFTYRELGDLWGVDKQGVWLKLDAWARDYPGLVHIEKDTTPHSVYLTFSDTEAWMGVVRCDGSDTGTVTEFEHPEPEEFTGEETTIDYPPFIGDRAYNQVMDRLAGRGILEASNTLEFERLGWDSKYQRGGLTITIFDGKLPVLVAVGRFDNGFLITPLKISTPKLA